jgi:hypothetical protein
MASLKAAMMFLGFVPTIRLAPGSAVMGRWARPRRGRFFRVRGSVAARDAALVLAGGVVLAGGGLEVALGVFCDGLGGTALPDRRRPGANRFSGKPENLLAPEPERVERRE